MVHASDERQRAYGAPAYTVEVCHDPAEDFREDLKPVRR
jgi:hypothetical protein